MQIHTISSTPEVFAHNIHLGVNESLVADLEHVHVVYTELTRTSYARTCLNNMPPPIETLSTPGLLTFGGNRPHMIQGSARDASQLVKKYLRNLY